MILMEPRQKRAAFLARLKRELGVNGVEILSCSRLEASHLPILKRLPAVMISRGLGNQVGILQAGRSLLGGSRKVLLFTTPNLAASLRKGWKEFNGTILFRFLGTSIMSCCQANGFPDGKDFFKPGPLLNL